MNGYVNPRVILLPDPVGIDAEIQNIQCMLGNGLPWLEKAFGRAIRQQQEVTRKEVTGTLQDSPRALQSNLTVYFPEVYGPDREPINVMPNDNLQSYCFFILKDPSTFTDYSPQDPQDLITSPISIIFWYNLEKINPAKNYRFAEELKIDVLRILKGAYSLQLTQIFEAHDQVFNSFTLTDTYREYIKPPYAALRIDGFLSYPAFCENC